MSMFSKRMEKPRVEACLPSRILMTPFLTQGVPARGFWRSGGGGEGRCHGGAMCAVGHQASLGKHLSLCVTKGPFRRQEALGRVQE